MEKVCAFLEELGKQGIGSFFISCNFARKTMAAPDFASAASRSSSATSSPPKLLILEVTESQNMSPAEQEQLRENIEAVRAQGMRVIFDDFGAGFSSFRDLQSYPMDGLKLDKELVDHNGHRPGPHHPPGPGGGGPPHGLHHPGRGRGERQPDRHPAPAAVRRLPGLPLLRAPPEAEARKRITQGAHLADFTPVPLPPQ